MWLYIKMTSYCISEEMIDSDIYMCMEDSTFEGVFCVTLPERNERKN